MTPPDTHFVSFRQRLTLISARRRANDPCTPQPHHLPPFFILPRHRHCQLRRTDEVRVVMTDGPGRSLGFLAGDRRTASTAAGARHPSRRTRGNAPDARNPHQMMRRSPASAVPPALVRRQTVTLRPAPGRRCSPCVCPVTRPLFYPEAERNARTDSTPADQRLSFPRHRLC